MKLGGLMSYGLVLLGTGMIGVALGQALSGEASYAQGRLVLVNLLRSDPAQAERVCRQSRGTFYEAIGAALSTGAMAGTRDPAVIAQATKPAYEGVAMGIGVKTGMLLGKLKLAGMAIGGGLLMALSADGAIWFHVLVTLIAAVGALRLFKHKLDVESSLVRAKGEILPEVERALAEGRYVAPRA